jgi:hypothetical protein
MAFPEYRSVEEKETIARNACPGEPEIISFGLYDSRFSDSNRGTPSIILALVFLGVFLMDIILAIII